MNNNAECLDQTSMLGEYRNRNRAFSRQIFAIALYVVDSPKSTCTQITLAASRA